MPEKEYLIRFIPENCTQCYGCETACKSWRDLPYGIKYRRVMNIWNGIYPKVKSSSLSIACLHCAEPACMAACPAEAISKNEKNGRVLVVESLCIGCKACSDACPFGVPQFGENDIMQKCDLCFGQELADADPPCIDTCPGKALTLVEVTREEKISQEETVNIILKGTKTS